MCMQCSNLSKIILQRHIYILQSMCDVVVLLVFFSVVQNTYARLTLFTNSALVATTTCACISGRRLNAITFMLTWVADTFVLCNKTY